MNADERALYIISVAAELAGVHPQTLRIYERKGLIEPARTQGRSRRYSERDLALLRRIQELTNDGVSLAGVKKILELEAEPLECHLEVTPLRKQLLDQRLRRLFRLFRHSDRVRVGTHADGGAPSRRAGNAP